MQDFWYPPYGLRSKHDVRRLVVKVSAQVSPNPKDGQSFRVWGLWPRV